MKITVLFLVALFSALALTESHSPLRAAPRSLQDQDTVEDADHDHHEEGEEEHHDEDGPPVHDDEDEEHHDEDEIEGEHFEGDGHDHSDGIEDEHNDEDMDHSEGVGHEDHGDEDAMLVASSSISSSNKPWGPAIGAALIVNCATLIGLLILIPTLLGGRFFKSNETNNKRLHWFLYTLIPSFAAGALLATTVFLLLPESILLIGNETGAVEHAHRALQEENAEGQLAWKFGASFLGGFLLPILLGSLFQHAHEDEAPQPACPVCQEQDSIPLETVDKGVAVDGYSVGSFSTCDGGVCLKTNHHHHDDEEVWDGSCCSSCHEENDGAQTAEEATLTPAVSTMPTKQKSKKPINYRLASSLLLGDFFHNFADGIFLGTAFSLCTRSVAVAIVAATIYHELAQELADYFMLTAHCGLSPVKALVLNFVSGLSVMFGVILILAIDVNRMATGCILAISAGVYVHVAASECIPRMEKEIKSMKDRAVSALCFVLGAVPIGLVLLNHGHCEA